MSLLLRAALAGLVAALLCAAPAHAAPDQESTFQDDNELIYSPAAEVERTLDQLRSLGVDRLRITLLWSAVAPEPGSEKRPAGFDAADPAAYPPGAWDRYDTVVRGAQQRGMAVNFNITAPGPLWALETAPRDDVKDTYKPDPTEFGRFTAAVGRRYDGTYRDANGGLLPRVDYWSIYNEPNQSGWLTPQWEEVSKGFFVEAAPRIYRALANAAYVALAATGHADDTVLVGETAPKGNDSRGIKRQLKALVFVRLLYCVDPKLRPLRNATAERYGCRRDGDLEQFAAENPVLFQATGYAHHPYNLLEAPHSRPRDRDHVTIGSLSRLTRTLDAIFKRAGIGRKPPLYLTEYGYQTNPPDLFGVSWAQQAAYLDESEYIAYRNQRVRTLAQFLLVDDAPVGNFQTGLISTDGKRKPAYASYKLPVRVSRTRVRRGSRVTVWGMLRTAPAPPDYPEPHVAQIQFRPRGAKQFARLAGVTVDSPRGYFTRRVRIRRSGQLRIAFTRPGDSRATYSRRVRLTADRG